MINEGFLNESESILSSEKSLADSRRNFFSNRLLATAYYLVLEVTVKRALPLALLALITFFPPGLAILLRNPWILSLFNFFGCHVLLLIQLSSKNSL